MKAPLKGLNLHLHLQLGWLGMPGRAGHVVRCRTGNGRWEDDQRRKARRCTWFQDFHSMAKSVVIRRR
jgi:hypothetical protein